MMVMVTIGTVFSLPLPYKLIAVSVALTALVVLTVLSVKYYTYLASVGHQEPEPDV
jgi:hypothetical protein